MGEKEDEDTGEEIRGRVSGSRWASWGHGLRAGERAEGARPWRARAGAARRAPLGRNSGEEAEITKCSLENLLPSRIGPPGVSF